MHQSKLLHLLKILSPEEFKGFAKFVHSPFFNSNKHYHSFYTYLSKYYPDFSSSKLSKEKVFKYIYPKKNYNYNIISNLMSGFTSLAEEYLINLQFQKEPFEKKKMLNKAYGERKDYYHLFCKHTAVLQKEIENRSVKDIAYYQDSRAINHYFYFHPTTNRQTIGNHCLQHLTKNLDLFYAQFKLLYHLEMKARSYIFGEKYNVILKADAIVREEQLLQQEYPVCMLYAKLFQLYEQEQSSGIFQNIKSSFFQNTDNIGQEERSIILLHLLNYCIRQINKGFPQYYQESFDLYKMGLTHHAFIEQNRMAEVTFSNIVSTGVKCHAFEWVQQFIINYKQFLDKKERKDATLLSWAFLKFYQKRYEETSQLLNNHSFNKPLHIIKAKSLLLRTYFEQFVTDVSYFDLLIAQTHAFERYIRRMDNISIQILTTYVNFTQLLRQVAFGLVDRQLPEGFIPSLESNDSLPCKDWLLQKAAMV